MEVIHADCAGLDVHKDTVVACVRKAAGGKVQRTVRSFGTTTNQLLSLSEWLTEHGITHVAMEATGVYWKPVWHILEGSFELVLANARRIRNVPGRKSDVNDATWIADLLAHGLIEASFVPERPIQELRDLTRTRKQLVRSVADTSNRIQKVLEDANIKLGSVISDVLGKSGRTILDALVAGETDAEKLAELADSRVKASRAQLREVLQGKVTEHHRFMLRLLLQQYDQLQELVQSLDLRIEEVGRPFAEAAERLIVVPGISRTAAFTLIAEVGPDMRVFGRPERLVSFAGVCPRLEESAGKKLSTRTPRRNAWLKTVIVSCAWAAARSKNTYYRAQFHRLKARRGPMKAVIAVAGSLMKAVYFILSGATYREMGADFFDHLNRQRTVSRLTKRLADLGYKVALTPAA